MAERRRYYSRHSCGGYLDAGRELEISKSTYFNTQNGALSELVQLPAATLESMRTASIDKETAIYEKLCAATEEWEAQAQETGSLDAALEYLWTKAVKHTANQWTVDEYGKHRISNMVYSMSYHIYEKTSYDRKLQKSVPVAWEVSWNIYFNIVKNPDYDGPGRRIAGQDRKCFSDKAESEKYLQGRIAAYAHLFTELSPPIPDGHQRRFCVKGQLLPGYTVEAHKPSVDEMLASLDEDDFPAIEETAPRPEAPKEEQEKPRPRHPAR